MIVFKAAVVICAVALGGVGCQANALSTALSRFADEGKQEDLDVLDQGGYEGGLLLIGILESGGKWALRDGWIDVAFVRMAHPKGKPLISGRDALIPTKTFLGSWIIRNPYALDWAQSHLEKATGQSQK
jgi:hypothetical protein